MKIKTKKGIDKKLDDTWAKLVKLRAGNKCEVCQKTTYLNSHHIYSRAKRSTRWHPKNGVCLCVAHHVFSSRFSAHKTPLEFTEWLYNTKGDNYMLNLKIRANTVSKLHPFEKELMLKELQKEIKQYDDLL